MNWYIGALKKYTDFSGRARRKEYWSFYLINLIAIFLLAFIEAFITGSSHDSGVGILVSIYLLATLLPSLAVTVRRLHDTDRSGWWILIAFIPLVGIVLLVFMLLDSTPGSNDYGPNPKQA